MTILFGDYKVKSNSTGWIMQKKRGTQWKKTQYFNSTRSLVDTLVKQTFNKRTGNLFYHFADEDEAVYILETMGEMLDSLREEILGVFYDELTHS